MDGLEKIFPEPRQKKRSPSALYETPIATENLLDKIDDLLLYLESSPGDTDEIRRRSLSVLLPLLRESEKPYIADRYYGYSRSRSAYSTEARRGIVFLLQWISDPETLDQLIDFLRMIKSRIESDYLFCDISSNGLCLWRLWAGEDPVEKISHLLDCDKEDLLHLINSGESNYYNRKQERRLAAAAEVVYRLRVHRGMDSQEITQWLYENRGERSVVDMIRTNTFGKAPARRDSNLPGDIYQALLDLGNTGLVGEEESYE